MPFISINDYEPIELAPGARARTPYGENVMLSYLELDEGAVIPPHRHPHEQAGMLLVGRMELTIGEQTRQCEPKAIFTMRVFGVSEYGLRPNHFQLHRGPGALPQAALKRGSSG